MIETEKNEMFYMLRDKLKEITGSMSKRKKINNSLYQSFYRFISYGFDIRL